VTGTKITLFRKQDRVLVESDGKTRVQALFNPEDNPADQ
jgi:lipopolysaccharide export system protein LptA